MKGVVIRGKIDGPHTMEPSKKVKMKKLMNMGYRSLKVPLTMSDLTRKGKNNGKKSSEVSDVHENHAKPADQPTKEILDIAPIQIVVPVDIQGNFSKTKPVKKNVENV